MPYFDGWACLETGWMTTAVQLDRYMFDSACSHLDTTRSHFRT